MKFQIRHSIRGRIRVHIIQEHSMTYEEADTLLYYLQNDRQVIKAKVYDRTADAVVFFEGDREHVIGLLKRFHYDEVELPEGVLENSGRELEHRYEERLLKQVLFHYVRKCLLPVPFAACYTGIRSVKYVAKGLKSLGKRKPKAPVLDAAAIGVSALRGGYTAANSVMFLLEIGETLEKWIHKRSVENLARTLSLNEENVRLSSESLDMPASVLSAIREAGKYHITVKGGKFLEAVAEADTIIFDKTGTLTKATPTVARVYSFCKEKPEKMLRIAACIEEHFSHSMASAVVDAAAKKGLLHEEMHAKVEYVAVHGISAMIQGKRAIMGSYRFVLEDEKCKIPAGKEEMFRRLPVEYSHLYLALDGELAAVICIEDPLREEAAVVISALKKAGFANIVMMTGDGERTAKAVAANLGIDTWFSEVLPEDKADFVAMEHEAGRKVIVVGEGINDSQALSAADVGIVLNEGSKIAKESADIIIGEGDLQSLLTLKWISDGLIRRMKKDYRLNVGFNAGLIGLGATGVIKPTTSALLHNASTLAIGVKNMQNILS